MHIRQLEWLAQYLLYRGVDFNQEDNGDLTVVDVNNIEYRLKKGCYIAKCTKGYVTIEKDDLPRIKVKRREVYE